MKQMDANQFLADVANHKMTVLVNAGLYRHLRFRRADDNFHMWFEVVTWPDCLAIRGDMGRWSFSRVEDMFTFFRSAMESKELKINASYWHEKVESESRFGGPAKKFDPEVFKANVLSHLDDCDLTAVEKSEIIEELDSLVFGENNEARAREALAEYKSSEGFTFCDSWEINGEGYTYHYLWCLYAIVWTIQQYDSVHPLKPLEIEAR